MSRNHPRLVIDTCIWVDSYCPSHVGCEPARELIERARAKGATLLYPVHCIKDVQYVLMHEFRRIARQEQGGVDEATGAAIREGVLACLRNMADLAHAIGGDASDVWLALKYLNVHPDLEDNLVLSACRRGNANFLVTSDRKLIEAADIAAKTPQQMLAILELDERS